MTLTKKQYSKTKTPSQHYHKMTYSVSSHVKHLVNVLKIVITATGMSGIVIWTCLLY